MKIRFLFLQLLILCLPNPSCVKRPDAAPYTVPCVYSFDGGSDLTTLFDLTATYIGANGETITEAISSLPWQKALKVSPPFKANLEVLFARKTLPSDQSSYTIGFAGNISDNKSAVVQNTSEFTEQLPTNETATRHLRFSVPIEEGLSADQIQLQVAPLKFDKHFVFTYTADDAIEGAYARIWRRIHKKWIDDTEFFHLGLPSTTGYQPTEPLSMSDGCGNERRFGFSLSLWPTYRNSYNNYEPRISESSLNSIYITWKEIEYLTDFDCSICLHNCDETRYDKNDPVQITLGLNDDYAKILERIGRPTKVFALPDGNLHYMDAVRHMGQIEFSRNSLTKELIRPKSCGSLYKKETYGGGTTQTIGLKLAELAQQSDARDPYWVGLTSHRVGTEWIDFFEKLYQLYGKNGKDNLWVASWDEVYEYIMLREQATILKSVTNDVLTFEVELPAPNNFYFHELSFLLDGFPSGTLEITPESSNIVGMSHARRGTQELINLNFDPQLLTKTEKYVARYEAYSQTEDKEDALYLIGRLLPSLRTPFMERLERKESHPVTLQTFSINHGATRVYNTKVTLSIKCTGEVEAWRISENYDFQDALWQPYTAEEISHTIAATEGERQFYLQVKNAWNTSNTLSATITKIPLPSSGSVDKEAATAYQEQYDGYKAVYARTFTTQ